MASNNLFEQNYSKIFSIKNTILFVILFAGITRIWGIWHGYPYSYYPDEAHFVKRALSFGSGDLNPHWFHKPAFLMYLLFFEYGLFFLAGKLADLWSSVSDFAQFYIINPGPFYIIGRITSALFGIGTVWLVYRLGERFWNKTAGIAGALLLTFSYGHIVGSQYVKADVPATFFGLLSMMYLVEYLEESDLKSLIKAALAAGAGAATKVYPMVMLGPICLAVLIVYMNTNDGIMPKLRFIISKLVISVAVFWATYFLCSPYSFIDSLGRESVFGWFDRLLTKIAVLFGNGGLEGPGAWISQRVGHIDGLIGYFHVLMASDGMGWLAAGAGIVGCLYFIYKAESRFIIFLLYPVLIIASSVITSPGYAEPRHQLPIYPFMAVAGGGLVTVLAERLKIDRKYAFAIFLLFLCWPAYLISQRGVLISKPDTRNLAKAWIESHIPQGTKLLIDENGPQLLKSEKSLVLMLEKAQVADDKGQFTAHYDTYLKYQLAAAKKLITYEIHEIRFPWWREAEIEKGVHQLDSEYDRDMGNPLKPVGVEDFDYYIKNGFEYVIVHSEFYDPFLRNTQVSKNFPSFTKFYRELFNLAQLVKEFDPKDGGHPGPTVKIFALSPESKNKFSSLSIFHQKFSLPLSTR